MGASVKPETPHILSFDEWQATQYAPHRVDQADPTKPMGQGRILTFDEWQKAQAAGNPSTLQFPAMPKIASDATKRLNPNAGASDATIGGFVHGVSGALDVAANTGAFGAGGDLVAHGLAAVGRQVVEPVAEHPLQAAAMLNPVGAVVGAGMAVHTIAKYGWQVAHEQFMSPEDRAKAEADPDRVSGEAAAVQAVMLGLGGLHVAAHAIGEAADVGAGVTEAGATGMKPYFESPKGAEALGTAAGAHGLPETASPFPPASPQDAAWKQGHASAVPALNVALEGATPPAGGPPEGHTRLYRTETGAGGTAEGVRNFTDNLEYAKIYRGERRSYVDVPTSDLGTKFPGMESEMKGATIYQLPPEASAVRKPFVEGENQPPNTIPANTRAMAVDEAQGRLAPVEGTGPTRTRGLAAGVEAKAVEAGLTARLGDLPEYRQLNMADQAAKATSLLQENPELARRVALGETPAPEGLHPEAAFVAVENKAISEGDVATIRDLASSKLTEQATTMGQRIRTLAERNPDSPVDAIQAVAEARGGGKDVGKAVNDAVAELKAHIEKGSTIDESAWTKFIDSIRC